MMEKSEFMERVREACGRYQDGYLIAQCTNRLIIGRAGDAADWEDIYVHGFDIRIFDRNGEIRWLRGTIADDFAERERVDDANLKQDTDYMEEDQFLDIDEKASVCLRGEGKVRAIGGGVYQLPLKNISDARIRIRNYLSYEEDTGKVYVSDWRCVSFVEGGEENG